MDSQAGGWEKLEMEWELPPDDSQLAVIHVDDEPEATGQAENASGAAASGSAIALVDAAEAAMEIPESIQIGGYKYHCAPERAII